MKEGVWGGLDKKSDHGIYSFYEAKRGLREEYAFSLSQPALGPAPLGHSSPPLRS